MESFIEFLKEYKELLVSALCVLLTLIGMLIKRKPKTLDEFMAILDKVLTNVPSYCYLVERPGDGESKKIEVMEMVKKDMSKYLGRELTNIELGVVFGEVSDAIEMILKAPQKKEVSK